MMMCILLFSEGMKLRVALIDSSEHLMIIFDIFKAFGRKIGLYFPPIMLLVTLREFGRSSRPLRPPFFLSFFFPRQWCLLAIVRHH
jgi:hypothetical protein